MLALESPSTQINWLCMPRFDSTSVFGRILDVEKGGTFAFQTDATDVDTRMEYVVNTNVLRTAVTCTGGRFDVRRGRDTLAGEWEAWADGYREEILDHAYNTELGYFTQVFGGRFPDASPKSSLCRYRNMRIHTWD